MGRPASGATILVTLLSVLQLVSAANHSTFKTCPQSGFCKRNRALADSVSDKGPEYVGPYEFDATSASLDEGILTATVWKNLKGKEKQKVELPLKMSFLADGTARVQIDEAQRQKGEIELRDNSKARKERYNEAEIWALVGGKNVFKDAKLTAKEGYTIITYSSSYYRAVINHNPFKITFKLKDEELIVFNERRFMNIDHWRPIKEKKVPEEEEEEEEGWWDEAFGFSESKTRGSESVALDITFPGYEHVYGIPAHASSLSLKETRGGEGNYNEPYRLFNTDIPEYEVDSPMGMYGSIPFMQAQKPGRSIAVFWLNSAETWIDVVKSKKDGNKRGDTKTHWMSETGVLDVFFFPGPNPTSIYKQFGHLTGFGVLPVEFSIAYHQCRWNYESANEVLRVNHNFDIFEMPYDAIWLDIEYTDDHKYFTWHPKEFRDPAAMQSVLDEAKRKLVVIIDPHIKVDKNYNISQQLSEKGLAVKDKSGNAYEGKCWPGLSNWIDGFNPATRSWWGSLFNINTFPYATENMHLWNDMNEPSVFDGPEASMPRDNLHHGNWEHRDVHNLYGMTVHSATYEGMVVRLGEGKKRRAFVLTRSYFAGSQRTAAVWTGDNQAEWSHLQQAFPMILSHGIAGMSFIGADVGGFAQTPSDELFTRWFQAGAFYPFFRSHSIKDVKRREPWMKGDTDIIRKALRLRYSLLPAWYTAFQRTSVEGIPVLRPNFVMFPNDEAGYAIDDQFYLGDSGLLVKPVVHEGAESVQIYLADDEPYYDYGAEHTLHQGKGMVTIAAPLWKIPMLHRGGHIYARKDRIRRSSTLMKYDPYTLVVAVSSKGKSEGTLYVDDGETFGYQDGQYVHRKFYYNGKILKSGSIHPEPSKAKEFEKSIEGVKVERIVIVGVSNEWTTRQIEVEESGIKRKVEMTVKKGENGGSSTAEIRGPWTHIINDWQINF